MPGFDGTGTRGMGPMTGGGRGRCNPYFRGINPQAMGFSAPQFMNRLGYPNPMAPWIPDVQGFRAIPRRFWGPCRGSRRWQW